MQAHHTTGATMTQDTIKAIIEANKATEKAVQSTKDMLETMGKCLAQIEANKQ